MFLLTKLEGGGGGLSSGLGFPSRWRSQDQWWVLKRCGQTAEGEGI